MTRLLAMAVVVTVAGCGSSTTPGSEDAGSGSDAATAPSVDASASCSSWRLVDVSIDSAYSMEALPIHPERSARILVNANHCPGDLPAPPVVAPTLENEFLAIAMRVWRAAADCQTPQIVARPLTVRFPYRGQWTILTANDPLVVDVVGAPDVRCDSAGPCSLDCQCAAGEACLSSIGLGGPFSQCATPCEFSRECGGSGSCESFDDGLSFTCQPGSECAPPERPCPSGFTCSGGSCEPTFVLNNSTRRACTCDSDCDAALRCAWHFGASEGSCEAVCATTNDGWCQGPHTCGRGSVEPASDGVCAWVGD